MKKIFITCFLLFSLFSYLFADEGMWIPMLLKKYNIEDMQKKGFKLTAEDIYSINNVSMKDGIVKFGGGCTGELVSEDGLLFTNHHCGYGSIQSHSTLDHDYLTDGFVARTKNEELSNPGLTVTFLIRMEDVTDIVLTGVSDDMTVAQRKKIISENSSKIIKKAIENTHYEASVEPFYNGNQYFLFVNEIFKDVRLVFAPPSSIGKFGGDTDNWMFPRHTGDFSMFRIYTAPDGSPATYSEENIPLKSKYFFKISTSGINEGDFTMILGYPARTQEYLPSYAVQQVAYVTDPTYISIRDKKLETIKKAMNKDSYIRIQYSNKVAGIANGWKKWIGESKGLIKYNAVEKKQEFELGFQKWANSTPELQKKYSNILKQYEDIYKDFNEYQRMAIYVNEAGFGADAVDFSFDVSSIIINKDGKINTLEADSVINVKLENLAKSFYKNYNENVDKELFAEMMKIFRENLPEYYRPEILKQFDKITKKVAEEEKYSYFANYVYSKSLLSNPEKFKLLINDKNKLLKDPIYNFAKDLSNAYFANTYLQLRKYSQQIDSLNRVYMKAQLEYQNDKYLFPDANFTMRLSYGNVTSYSPADGIQYKYYTTFDGIIEKDNPDIYDYDVPDKLKELYEKKDFGRYADERDGKVHVCFTATNHTSGGNSGSPVINANGELIGINFDRNWEGTMSDINYNVEICRNISLDIRYALFIIEKFAGARNLIEEMEIIW